MKKFAIFLGLFLFMSALSVYAGPTGPSGQRITVAPLDGGLLLVLGGAGVAYFAARKKKKNL
jgi:hypothetical protein